MSEYEFEFDMVALAKYEAQRIEQAKASLNSGAAEVAARHNARQAARRAELAARRANLALVR